MDPHCNVVGVLDAERLFGDNPQTKVLENRKYIGKHDRIFGTVNGNPHHAVSLEWSATSVANRPTPASIRRKSATA
jgi:hypothetical protein